MKFLARFKNNCRVLLLTTEKHGAAPRFVHESDSKPPPAPQKVRFYKSRLLPLGILTALLGVAFSYYKNSRESVRVRAQESADSSKSTSPPKPFRIRMYRLLPWRTFSRCSGWFFSLNLPNWTNQRLLSWYVRTFGVNLDEAKEPDLAKYKNLAQLFTRELKEEVRPVHKMSPLVSPCDGTVLHFNRIEVGQELEGAILPGQVKGVLYSLASFFGITEGKVGQDDENLRQELLGASGAPHRLPSSLYCCILYLSPGSYHRFHSPVNWTLRFRRHCPGELLSVHPKFTRQFPQVFCINERVLYTGQWEYGFFSMCAVGATNVGSIQVYHDRELVTNEARGRRSRSGAPVDAWFFGDRYEPYKDALTSEEKFRIRSRLPIRFRKGDPFGQFNLGSTIVLVFQAPSDFEPIFKKKVGREVKFGESLL